MPPSSAGLSRRGFDASGLLVRALAKLSGLPMAKGLLSLRRQTADQRALAASDRESNLFESMQARQGQGRLLIVDDIVTTGASVLESRRALISSGYEVAGFITIAETLLQKLPSLSKDGQSAHEWV
jgi:predicted amidophosphoribosyltransferase